MGPHDPILRWHPIAYWQRKGKWDFHQLIRQPSMFATHGSGPLYYLAAGLWKSPFHLYPPQARNTDSQFSPWPPEAKPSLTPSPTVLAKDCGWSKVLWPDALPGTNHSYKLWTCEPLSLRHWAYKAAGLWCFAWVTYSSLCSIKSCPQGSGCNRLDPAGCKTRISQAEASRS